MTRDWIYTLVFLATAGLAGYDVNTGDYGWATFNALASLYWLYSIAMEENLNGRK